MFLSTPATATIMCIQSKTEHPFSEKNSLSFTVCELQFDSSNDSANRCCTVKGTAVMTALIDANRCCTVKGTAVMTALIDVVQ